ncbi:hypothetical protein GGR07_001164 [Bacteroides pyogenes]|nr:hypothetical protein [Bacteroides pyogenes]SUV33080.1 Uncharacterised protein [Bacteroides pyogenes]
MAKLDLFENSEMNGLKNSLSMKLLNVMEVNPCGIGLHMV